MRLKAFRVQNYKKIADTGWVTCRDLTVFVGKNEAGKSAVFRALSKLNPSDGEKYDGLREFPRRRYSDEYAKQDWLVATGRFVFDDNERAALTKLCPQLAGIKSVEVTRYYSWKLTVGFDPTPKAPAVDCGAFREVLDKIIQQAQDLVAPEGKGDALAGIKQTLLTNFEQAKQRVPADGLVPKDQVEQLMNAVAAQANEGWQKQLLDPITALLREFVQRCIIQEQLQAARKWVADRLPKFIYFDKYDVIDSAIHIPTFVQQLNSTPHAPRVRTTACLFRHVGLDVNKLATLGRHRPDQGQDAGIQRQVDERAILSSSASNAMTKKFEDWWDQRKHEFHYRVDGDYFRIWVSDDLDPSEIELDQRSAGLQYFFSFYLVFLVEAEGEHANSILLLDEPGQHLHGTAQAKIVQFLRDTLSKANQTLYTTHSPFMVDMDHLECARAVYEEKDGTTKISEDVWPRDKHTLFPLQAALGYQLAQGLFISKRQVIVEGITDYWLLKAIDQALALKGRTRLRQDVLIVPSAGLSKLLPLASMLTGHDVEVAALLDGDEPGRKEGKKLVEKLLAGKDRKCLFIGDFTSKKEAEIEDLFLVDDYLAAVRETYPGVDLSFNSDEDNMPRIVERLKSLFERKELGMFEKWRPVSILRDRILDDPDKVSGDVLDVFERIYQALNGLFDGLPSQVPVRLAEASEETAG